MFLHSVCTAAFLASSALAQFVTPPTNLTTKKGYLDIPVRYKQVPTGICETTPGVKSYSGYVDIAPEQHIFWWFFETRHGNPSEAPLTVWINGGPGSSSMIGLFQELGPCGIDANYNVVSNPYSWNNASNMLFIDHPAQVGFSYSKPIPGYKNTNGDIIQVPDASCPDYAQAYGTCGTYSYANQSDTANSTANAAPSMWKTLQGFMGAFPQYARNGFHFTTESYGGHYGPVFNEYIETQNALIKRGRLQGAKEIQLESVMIGNGWYRPLVQYAAYYNYTVYPGNPYDYSPYNKTIQDQLYNAMYGQGNCYDQTVDCNTRGINSICAAADSFCANEVESVLDNVAVRDEYDIREPYNDPFPPTFYVQYLNTPYVQQAIGAYVNFSESSNTVGAAFASTGDDDREDNTIEDVQALLKKGIYVVQYYGDADYNCNYLGGQVVADEINAFGYSSAGFTNISTSDKIVHGQVRQSGNFAFARIYESGHEVPFYQPVVALELFERVLQRKDVATGRQDIGYGYKTSGPLQSTYREGNSTLVFDDLPVTATYNTTTNRPNPVTNSTTSAHLKKRGQMGARSVLKRNARVFKPSYEKRK
ncbi:hypothetical protein AMS68_007146 [Peltaster fructicola]|uniref:Carboxypeptidase n=1 Tax=Peltaster fructicola TaxID=286661 RepID=A0A6H0Y459_9PEZI|nr:hypothetical protein AMS68_007146 [Peltaster fructicola]